MVHNVGGLTFVSIEKFCQIGGSQVPAGKGDYYTFQSGLTLIKLFSNDSSEIVAAINF